ncbi:hypothetical protein CMU84_16435 [Elizabethkingia anophelis]|nr:hypothetical protein [Elizabethkingia anophelis]MDV3734240.1 hypothetical protein [Elizabethkingia anophelis]
MKTKYVKVPVSERLPDKRGDYIIIIKDSITPTTRYFGKAGFEHNNIEFWLEEKEDHSEEMLSLLEFIKGYGSKCDWNKLEKDIEELINKVKDNDSK